MRHNHSVVLHPLSQFRFESSTWEPRVGSWHLNCIAQSVLNEAWIAGRLWCRFSPSIAVQYVINFRRTWLVYPKLSPSLLYFKMRPFPPPQDADPIENRDASITCLYSFHHERRRIVIINWVWSSRLLHVCLMERTHMGPPPPL